jgi:hypothetical protein
VSKTLASMIDDGFRIGFLIIVGLAILLLAGWLLNRVFQEIAGKGQIVIDQFTVVRTDGKTDEEFGKGLAQGLQARLPLLVRELQGAQAGLSSVPTASDASSVAAARQNLGLPKIIPPGGFSTTLLQPVDLKISVAGVDVGGVIPWLQRQFINNRTLFFTISIEDDRVEIYGSLAAITDSDSGLNLTILGENGKPPTLRKIVDMLAHDLLRRYYLFRDPNNKLESLTAEEFEDLSDVLVGAELAKRQTASGRHGPEAFAKLVPTIVKLSSTAPNWPELGYLAAWIADNGEDTKTAIKYYEQVRPQFMQLANTDLARRIDERVIVLASARSPATGLAAGTAAVEAAAAPAPGAPALAPSELPVFLDYSSEVHIRNGGQEASVVGLALATALEFKLSRRNIEKEISARYIYNLGPRP